MDLRRTLVALAVAACAAPLTFAPASADPPPESPDAEVQPLLDGCQRNNTGTLALQSPEWVYVDRAGVLAQRAAGVATAGRQTVEGVVTASRHAGDDLFVNHDFYDVNIGLDPDPAYEFLLPDYEAGGADNHSRLGTELEAPAMPEWAMPSIGDRARLSGNWIWDCGHWGNPGPDPGIPFLGPFLPLVSQFVPFDPVSTLQDLQDPSKLEGEDTELHPLYEVAVFRAHWAGFLTGLQNAREISRLDVWITGDGTPAHSEEECALYQIGFGAALRDPVCPRHRDVGGSYAYTLALGPKPTPASTVVVNPVIVHPETNPGLVATPVSVVSDATAGTVTVSFSLPHTGVPQRFGISVEAGWTQAAQAVHHVVTLDQIEIAQTLDGDSEPHDNPGDVPGEQAPEPGEWVLYANVSGRWAQLPGLAQVSDGQTIPLGLTFDFYLPQGLVPSLFVGGRECDIPTLDCRLESYGASPDPANPFTEAGFNDKPGKITSGGGAGAPVLMTLGTDLYEPALNPSTNGNEDLSDSTCAPTSCYRLWATWTMP